MGVINSIGPDTNFEQTPGVCPPDLPTVAAPIQAANPRDQRRAYRGEA